MQSCPGQAVRPLVGLAADKIIRERYKAAETENGLNKLRDAGFLKKELVNPRVREGIEVRKMLNGLVRGIRNSAT
ncbi:MAG: hypothetical protein ACODAD_00510 [Planctomycetota bacterium]